ncbi:CheR family methyltransferase [Archangium minus]|uniref:CheR family methyltransferase n=1 Tax=Archangium minus TaxID=83450 RepID=UPI0037C18AC9
MATKAPRDHELEAILEKVRQVRNFDFRNYKRATLQRRIERRMAATRCRTRAAYLALLERDPTEVNTLVSSMLIKLTTFFRDIEVWQALERVLRELVRRRRPDQEVRIWSAGCATGEEAYSIAIAAAEALGPGYPGPELKVFGTDVDEGAISAARRGIYAAEQLENVSKERLARWFVPVGNEFMVRWRWRPLLLFTVGALSSLHCVELPDKSFSCSTNEECSGLRGPGGEPYVCGDGGFCDVSGQSDAGGSRDAGVDAGCPPSRPRC